MNERRCFACMNLVSEDDYKCPSCGDILNQVAPKQDLATNTLLKDRFLIGLAQSRNGEGVTYMAFDKAMGIKVLIKEFFPDTIVTRADNHLDVVVNAGCDIKFKGLEADFIELFKKLTDFSGNSNIIDVQEIFECNNTVYVVTEYLQGMNLSKFLLAQAGELTWTRADKLFLPLLYVVKSLNNNGIIHRAISPDNIIVRNNKLVLTGFCISATRSTNSQLREEVYSGYAAPEQYQRCAAHGTWTDVYGMSAVLYKVLTGTMPTSAEKRSAGDGDVLEPTSLNSAIPVGVSRAISAGLTYSTQQRTQTIEGLIEALYYKKPEPVDIMSDPEPEEVKKQRVPLWLKVILISLPIMLAMFAILYFSIMGSSGKKKEDDTQTSSSSENVSTPTSSKDKIPDSNASVTADSVAVVDFKGKKLEDIKKTPAYNEMFKFTVAKYQYSEDNEYGVVLEQEQKPDSTVKKGSEISVILSKGPQNFFVPPFHDNDGIPLTPDAYSKALSDKGVGTTIVEVESRKVKKGGIVDIAVRIDGQQVAAAGKTIDREVTNNIIIMVSSGSNQSQSGDNSSNTSSTTDNQNRPIR
ncbi:MAG: protein kinase [Oscillospiraceae bacterium]